MIGTKSKNVWVNKIQIYVTLTYLNLYYIEQEQKNRPILFQVEFNRKISF